MADCGIQSSYSATLGSLSCCYAQNTSNWRYLPHSLPLFIFFLYILQNPFPPSFIEMAMSLTPLSLSLICSSFPETLKHGTTSPFKKSPEHFPFLCLRATQFLFPQNLECFQCLNSLFQLSWPLTIQFLQSIKITLSKMTGDHLVAKSKCTTLPSFSSLLLPLIQVIFSCLTLSITY